MALTPTTSIRDDGFTLIEVLVAMTIAAVGFLGLAATHMTSVRATVLGRNVSLATNLANEAIETLRRTPYAEIVSTSPTVVTREGIPFTTTTTVAALGTSSLRVTQLVSWRDQFGNHPSGVQLVTVIAE
jgi:prepilin-type N-terminal cleavage/methylation domain-containing protein